MSVSLPHFSPYDEVRVAPIAKTPFFPCQRTVAPEAVRPDIVLTAPEAVHLFYCAVSRARLPPPESGPARGRATLPRSRAGRLTPPESTMRTREGFRSTRSHQNSGRHSELRAGLRSHCLLMYGRDVSPRRPGHSSSLHALFINPKISLYTLPVTGTSDSNGNQLKKWDIAAELGSLRRANLR
jgi:hypothetical protein